MPPGLSEEEKKRLEEAEKLKKELESKGYRIPPKTGAKNPMDQVMNEIVGKLPLLFDQFVNREKRIKISMEVTSEEMMRLGEYMHKNKIGKTQLMEDP